MGDKNHVWKVTGTVTGLALVWWGIRGGILNPLNSTNSVPRSLESAPLSRKATSVAEEIEFARQDQTARDHEALKNRSASDTEIFGALVRLGQAQDLEARTQGLKRVTSRNALIRQGVANALGNFDDPICLAALHKLIKDPEEAVRLQAIASLGRRPGAERAKTVEEVLADPSLKPAHRIAALKSLFQAADGPSAADQKKRAVTDLISEVNSLASPHLQAEAMAAMTSLAPRDPEVLALLHKRLPQEKNPIVASNSILHLGIVGDTWLKENLKVFARHSDPRIQQATLRVLHMLCPKNRWTLMSGIVQSQPSPEVLLSVIQEALTMPGPRAKSLFEEIVRNPKTSPAILEAAKSALEKLPLLQAQDPCESVKK